MSDEETLRRFVAGDERAVRALYAEYRGPVFTVALAALGQRALAEEAVQETFIKAWRAASRFDPSRSFAPWLYTIARRVAVDIHRRERRHNSGPLDVEVAVLSPSFQELWEAWQVRVAIDALPDDERQVLEATYFHEQTHQEAAGSLGVPLGTVKSRSHRAHRRLAGWLGHIREASA
jgi:RNA polymerase sigma-70 factor (ECF subfamily)